MKNAHTNIQEAIDDYISQREDYLNTIGLIASANIATERAARCQDPIMKQANLDLAADNLLALFGDIMKLYRKALRDDEVIKRITRDEESGQ